MIVYLGRGPRDYTRQVQRPYVRHRWEFQIFTDGRHTCTYPGGAGPWHRGAGLYVLPPQAAHGWLGRTSEVIVFHLDHAPQLLVERLPGMGSFLRLSAADLQRVRCLGDLIAREHASPSDHLHLIEIQVETELTLLALRDQRRPLPQGSAQRSARRRVGEALAWYAMHLDEAPALDQVASAARCSVAHLRRLCHAVQGHGPQAACDQIRYARAKELLLQGISVEATAFACGFSAASAFSRGFHHHCGVGPRAWRQRRLGRKPVTKQT